MSYTNIYHNLIQFLGEAEHGADGVFRVEGLQGLVFLDEIQAVINHFPLHVLFTGLHYYYGHFFQ